MRAIPAALSVVLAASIAAPLQSQVAPPDNLMGWSEPFGYVGVTTDPRAVSMIPGGDGSSQGGVSVAQGMVGTAYQFNGANAHVALPDPGFDITQSFTIEAWVYFDMDANPLRNYILSKGDPETSLGGWALMTNGLGQWHFHFDESPIFPSPAFVLPDLQWVHIAVTCDGSSLRFYQSLPGEPFATPRIRNISGFTPVNGGGDSILIGNSPGGGNHFGGRIDEMAFYSPVSRTRRSRPYFLLVAQGS